MNQTIKTALITGGSEGLGLHIARLLASKGYELLIVGRDSRKLDEAIQSLAGSNHRSFSVDLSTTSGTTELIRLIEQETFDVLVNNAGATRFGAMSTLSRETLEQSLHLNFTAPALLSWAFLQNSRPGSILVNVTSVVGTIPVPGNTPYSAAKAGLQALTESLWYEQRANRVRVIDFRPAAMGTNFHRAAGGASLSGSSAGTPEAAAKRLVAAIEGNREFICSFGLLATAFEVLRRMLPKKILVRMTGKKSRKAGYL